MIIQVYDQKTLTLVSELSVSGLNFDVQGQRFLLNAGYSRTPVQAIAPPVEFLITRSEVRVFFQSKTDAEDFIIKFQQALGEAERRNNSMLD
jgi:hypothetical protein